MYPSRRISETFQRSKATFLILEISSCLLTLAVSCTTAFEASRFRRNLDFASVPISFFVVSLPSRCPFLPACLFFCYRHSSTPGDPEHALLPLRHTLGSHPVSQRGRPSFLLAACTPLSPPCSPLDQHCPLVKPYLRLALLCRTVCA